MTQATLMMRGLQSLLKPSAAAYVLYYYCRLSLLIVPPETSVFASTHLIKMYHWSVLLIYRYTVYISWTLQLLQLDCFIFENLYSYMKKL